MPFTGTISSANFFASIAAAAFFWLWSANSSCYLRSISKRFATFSAVMPIGV